MDDAPAGSVLHAIAEEGVPTRDHRRGDRCGLDLPVVSIPADQAGDHFGWMARFFGVDVPASNTITRELLGWEPTHPGLIEDLDEGHYFAPSRRDRHRAVIPGAGVGLPPPRGRVLASGSCPVPPPSTMRSPRSIGQPISPGGPNVAPDPVNQPMIRHWAAAFEDANPVYVDADAAAASRHGEIVAPPLMLQTWSMATPKITGIRERGGSPVEGGGAEVLRLLDAGRLRRDARHQLRVRDRPVPASRRRRVGRDRARVGVAGEADPHSVAGRFVTWVTTYTDATGERGRAPDVPHPEVRPEGLAGVSIVSLPDAARAVDVTPDTQFFWDGLRERRLLVQRCDGCGALRHPPRPMCPRCHSLAWTAVESSGRGTILSAVIMRHPQYPWFETDPVVVLVELEEGWRLVANLVGVESVDDVMGAPVEVRFERLRG